MAGPTHRTTWQKSEARIAAIFGARRNPGSGTQGRPDVLSASDSTHPRLFIEAKLQAKSAIRTLFESVRPKAKAEGKIPVLAIAEKGRPGVLIVVRAGDLAAVAAEVVSSGGEDVAWRP